MRLVTHVLFSNEILTKNKNKVNEQAREKDLKYIANTVSRNFIILSILKPIVLFDSVQLNVN